MKHGAIEIHNEPCPYCAVWIGPHRHWLREDGSLGLIVEPLPAPAEDGEPHRKETETSAS